MAILRAIMSPRLQALLLAGLLLAACSPLALVNVLVPEDNHRSEPGIAYGPEARHRLDVYRPPEGQAAKGVLVFFYGGSWKSGERGNYRFVGEAFASRGFLVVIPDYRLYPEVRFPAFVGDAALAVAWARRNLSVKEGAAGTGKDLPLVLMGHSAGAHIAALLALDPDYLAAAGLAPRSVSAWVGLAGPYAFDPFRFRGIRPIFETASSADEARPVTFARAGAPPALLLHGVSDGTVRRSNSQELAEALTRLKVPVRHIELPDTGHIGILLSLAAPVGDPALVIEPTQAFIEALPVPAPGD